MTRPPGLRVRLLQPRALKGDAPASGPQLSLSPRCHERRTPGWHPPTGAMSANEDQEVSPQPDAPLPAVARCPARRAGGRSPEARTCRPARALAVTADSLARAPQLHPGRTRRGQAPPEWVGVRPCLPGPRSFQFCKPGSSHVSLKARVSLLGTRLCTWLALNLVYCLAPVCCAIPFGI